VYTGISDFLRYVTPLHLDRSRKRRRVYNCGLQFCTRYTGGPKKVSHYRQSSLNRIKNRKPGYIFPQILMIK